MTPAATRERSNNTEPSQKAGSASSGDLTSEAATPVVEHNNIDGQETETLRSRIAALEDAHVRDYAIIKEMTTRSNELVDTVDSLRRDLRASTLNVQEVRYQLHHADLVWDTRFAQRWHCGECWTDLNHPHTRSGWRNGRHLCKECYEREFAPAKLDQHPADKSVTHLRMDDV